MMVSPIPTSQHTNGHWLEKGSKQARARLDSRPRYVPRKKVFGIFGSWGKAETREAMGSQWQNKSH